MKSKLKGYKGMKSDMTCRGKQFEIGKTYTEENVKLCRQGIHWCRNLKDVFDFYDVDGSNRFFEVDADEIETNGHKSVASTLTVIRELSEIEINKTVYGDSYGDSYGDGDGYGYGYGNGDGDGDGYGDIFKVLIFS